MVQRAHYWSSSKFANWLRGTEKPAAATLGEWRDWKSIARSTYPVRYWLAEEGLDMLQNFVNYPTDKYFELKYYIRNRFFTKSHALTSKNLKIGQWHDMDTRILNCLFDELVNFVEIEKAHMHCVFDKEKTKLYKRPSKWAIKEWRSKEAGLKYLEWEMSLRFNEDWGVYPGNPNYGKPTPQAENAAEILALYNWWTSVRLTRDDPFHASGYFDLQLSKGTSLDSLLEPNTPEEEKKISECFNVSNSIEDVYDNEDTEMLIRLIKIRKSLWT